MLIEQAGLKGTRVGGVEVSQRHANFIVADSGASSQDVLRLIDLIRSRVAERLGVELETELEIW
jgi:UDP-N-acetylmuramate dehydrogenase